MKLISDATLEKLIEKRAETCVSFYLPTYKLGQEVQQNTIRMKNLVAKAEDQMENLGLKREEITQILQPARDLVEQDSFWQQQSYGLALFLSKGDASIHRLPLSFDEQVYIGPRYHLKPLMPLFSGDGRFYLLRLDIQEIVLYAGSRYSIQKVEVENMPAGMEEALRFDDPENQLQHSTTTRTDGGHDAIHHGHGDNYDKKENILRYFHQVDDAVTKALGDETAPLLLAGVNYLLPIYRSTNEYPHLVSDGIGMDVDRMKEEDLQRRAWEILEPHFQEQYEEDRSRYFTGKAEGLASDKLEEIVAAAKYGRIDTLFVALDEERCGLFDADTNEVTFTDEDDGQDLLDYAAVHTLNNSGKVYAVNADQVPDGAVATAVFRYPMDQG